MDAANVIWLADSVALELLLPRGLRIDTNDLAGQSHGKVQSIRVPHAALRMLLANDSSTVAWSEALEFVADANIDMYSAPPGWREKARVQSEFLAEQDSHTGRAIFMYMPDQFIPYDALAPGALGISVWIATLTAFQGVVYWIRSSSCRS